MLGTWFQTMFLKMTSDMLAGVVFPLYSLILGSDPFSLERAPLENHSSSLWTTDDHHRDVSLQQSSFEQNPVGHVGVGRSWRFLFVCLFVFFFEFFLNWSGNWSNWAWRSRRCRLLREAKVQALCKVRLLICATHVSPLGARKTSDQAEGLPGLSIRRSVTLRRPES